MVRLWPNAAVRHWKSGWSRASILVVLFLCSCAMAEGVQFGKAAASASSASALCPHVVDPTLIKNIMQCPLAEQCSSDSACPSSRKCCLSFQARGNISAPSLCVGMGCVCPNITSLCPTLECQQYRLDSTGCSICQCASTSGATCPTIAELACKKNCTHYSFDVNNCPTCACAIATIPKPTGVCPASPSTSGVPTCSDIRQCQVDYQCPLARKCCSGIATTGGPTCVGKICRCSVLTLAECQPYCPPALGHSKIGIGADNCTTCLCVPNATIPPRTTSMPHTTATTVKSQTATSGITFVPDTLPGRPSQTIEFILLTSPAGITAISSRLADFSTSVSEFLSSRYSLTSANIMNLQASPRCCTSTDARYISITFVLVGSSQSVVQYQSTKIANDALAKRISFEYDAWPMTSGVFNIPGSTTTSSQPLTSVPSSASSNTNLIIYICAGGGAILVIMITILLIFICKRSGSVNFTESYSDPAPGVHFTSATGVVGHTMRPGYPEPGAAKPQLVFSQPLYESNPDTQQLVEDI